MVVLAMEPCLVLELELDLMLVLKLEHSLVQVTEGSHCCWPELMKLLEVLQLH